MNDVKLIYTEDGSPSLLNLKSGEHYHSIHGAVTESKHVFIKNGLDEFISREGDIRILEIGFGTGLNFFLSQDWAIKYKRTLNYTSLEPFLLRKDLMRELYHNTEFEKYMPAFMKMYTGLSGFNWITEHTRLHLSKTRLLNFEEKDKFDLVYFDAFSPSTEPEMWTEESLLKVENLMSAGAVFTTYCARGYVRRSLEKMNLKVERRPGPPGKREMIVAHK